MRTVAYRKWFVLKVQYVEFIHKINRGQHISGVAANCC